MSSDDSRDDGPGLLSTARLDPEQLEALKKRAAEAQAKLGGGPVDGTAKMSFTDVQAAMSQPSTPFVAGQARILPPGMGGEEIDLSGGTITHSPDTDDEAPAPPIAAPPVPSPPMAAPPVPSPPLPPPPPPVQAQGSPWGGGASAGAVVIKPEITSSEAATESAPPPEALDAKPTVARPTAATVLLWLDRKSLARVVKERAWQGILDDFDNEPVDLDFDDPVLSAQPGAIAERNEVLEILRRGTPLTRDEVVAELGNAASRARFVEPLVLLEGALAPSFDELESLKAVLSAAAGVAYEDDALERAVAAAKEYLSTPGLLSAPAVARRLTQQIRDALGQNGQRAAALAELDRHALSALLEGRRYRERKLFGGVHVRAILRTGEASELVIYVDHAVSDELPLRPSFDARVIAEAHFPVDQDDGSAVTLRALALAEVVPLPS